MLEFQARQIKSVESGYQIQDRNDVKCRYVIHKSSKGSMRNTDYYSNVQSNFQI